MRTIANFPAKHHHLEPLESRRLLSLTPVGDETVLPPLGGASDYDVAAADDGTYIVASAATADRDDNDAPSVLTVARFAPTGQPLGAPLTLASSGASEVTVSMDADGDAVVAWSQFQGNDMSALQF